MNNSSQKELTLTIFEDKVRRMEIDEEDRGRQADKERVLKEDHAREQLMSNIKAEKMVHEATQTQLENNDDKWAKGLQAIGLWMILLTMGMTILFSPLTDDFLSLSYLASSIKSGIYLSPWVYVFTHALLQVLPSAKSALHTIKDALRSNAME